MAIASGSGSRDVSFFVPPCSLDEGDSGNGFRGGGVSDDEAREAMLRLVATVVRRQGIEAVDADVMRFLLDELHSGEQSRL